MLKPQIIKLVQKRGIIPVMINSIKKISTSQIIAILMIKLNKPKVNILKGKVMNLRIGLIKKLIKPKIKPANKRIFQEPVKLTPKTNWLAIHSPNMPEAIFRKRLRIYNIVSIIRSQVNFS